MDGDLRLETLVVERLARTPHYGFAMLAYADMLTMGQVDLLGRPFSWNDAAIVAMVGDQDVGIVAFDGADLDAATVRLAYVHPDYRRRGIFRLMHAELLKWCERYHRRIAEFDAPVGNSAFGRTLVAVGAALATQCYRVEV